MSHFSYFLLDIFPRIYIKWSIVTSNDSKSPLETKTSVYEKFKKKIFKIVQNFREFHRSELPSEGHNFFSSHFLLWRLLQSIHQPNSLILRKDEAWGGLRVKFMTKLRKNYDKNLDFTMKIIFFSRSNYIFWDFSTNYIK